MKLYEQLNNIVSFKGYLSTTMRNYRGKNIIPSARFMQIISIQRLQEIKDEKDVDNLDDDELLNYLT